MNTKVFEARLSDKSVRCLRRTLGVDLSHIFSPALEVYDAFIGSPNFSLSLGEKGYLILENEWLETPENYVDYWQISASISQIPKDIKVESKRGQAQHLCFPVSLISLTPASMIIKITVHEKNWSDPECPESVVYDYAVVFYRADGKRVAIAAQDSIADMLEFTRDETEVKSIIEESKCRLIIE